jgi:hypothetical protein
MNVQAVIFPTTFPEVDKRILFAELAQRDPPGVAIDKCAILPPDAGLSVAAVYVAAGKPVIVVQP